MSDPYRLRRFELAQDQRGTYAQAVRELQAGRKTSHWMWFIFPQVVGLGKSSTSEAYSIASLAEAAAYLANPILGPRLIECSRILTELDGRTAEGIFGEVDAMKLRSSMTLFARAAPDNTLFRQVLLDYFGGAPDPATERILDSQHR
jgi:uncharacterized protein (DUF1810 family)